MSFTAAKCTNCGGELQLDENLQSGYCMHCGSKVIVKDAIELKKIQVEGKVSVEGVSDVENLLKRGKQSLRTKKYKEAVDTLISKGIENITSWPIGNPDGTRNNYTPSRRGLFGIQVWLHLNAKKCHGHVWGGGVFDYNGNILRYTDYVTKHDPKKDFVRQLVVFQDKTVAYSWIKEGALCMK